MNRKRYRNEIMEVIHGVAEDLHKIEAISDERMAEYDRDCLVKKTNQTPESQNTQSVTIIPVVARNK